MKRALTIILFTLLASQLFAQRRGTELIGVVDFNALVLMHPAMVDYIPSEKAFKVALNQFQAAQQTQKKAEIQSQISALKSQNNAVQARLIDLRRQYERDIEKLLSDYTKKITNVVATETIAYETQNYNLKTELREKKYQSEAEKLSQQLAGGIESATKLEKFISNEGYTSYDETIKRFALIINEVKQASIYVAEKHGMSVVMNSSSDRIAKNLLKQQESNLNQEFSYKNVLFSQYVQPHENHPSFKNSVSDYYANIVDNAKIWLQYENDILNNFYSLLPQGSIITGGSNITSEVLAVIFKQHKINENISKAITDMFLNY
ncbi:MAG: hypothetical protein PHS59_18675 [Paludibacter sp.]|nr:hypothetical protein [Paludibacter sp.]